ncbi:uncharacterized protein LOC110028861 [Phalaenopsis equestris]|uniref:uncharacterized protein LOC110028861 n=1 Tax=Phalaenopsis equestris TaxID=78828 RepID=UPI0009E53BB9|nr:uncharacterized protein LOC110028861 [Phalaenopsis equestris]
MKKLERRSGEAAGVIGKGDELPLVPARGCFGDGCEALDPWPVHQVRHRNNVFLRLCTSCVLKYHPGSFCCSCYEVLDSAKRPPLVHCSKCPSVSHLCCLPDPSIAPLYLCPACYSPSPTLFSYFPFSKNSTDRVIDLRAAKILFCAARLSAASMSRAAVLARADAEKKVKEAALARKRARDMLHRSLFIFEKENEKIRDSVRTAVAPVVSVANVAPKVEVAEPKKKVPRPSCTVKAGSVVQKRVQDREREKWKRFSEPIGLVNGPALVVDGNEKIKGYLNSDAKDGLVKDEEKKGILSGSFTEIDKQE